MPIAVLAFALALGTLFPAAAGSAQPPCPRAELPAYAHNDYRNPRPLLDALALGYRGVEADLFLVDGVLRLGHDRQEARRAGSLEAVYLRPLDSVVRACGSLTADGRAFLLTLELKERSPAAYDSLVSLLARYPVLFGDARARPAVSAILVGWHPAEGLRAPGSAPRLGVQYRLTRPSALPGSARDDAAIQLVSIDYGKTMGRWWVGAGERRRWIGAIRGIRASAPGLWLRVHNAPVDAALYRRLLDAGVDLIGATRLAEVRAALLDEQRSPSQAAPGDRTERTPGRPSDRLHGPGFPPRLPCAKEQRPAPAP